MIEARLGVGGMGEVFRARDGERPIALKLMRPELAADPHHRLLFIHEARLAAQLDHRNLVKLYECGKSGGVLWMALELVDGLALDRLLADAPLGPTVAAHVVLELLDALAYMHAHGMVHRDVSAANVLVSRAGAIKLSDFGVAKLTSWSLTRANDQKGKPSYMAPEQLSEHAPRGPIDGRVDLFAVGVLLYRMTQGRAPFGDVADWMRDGAPLSASGPLASVIARAMRPDRRARFADAKAMAAAILRELPAAANGEALAMAARVRACAAAAPPVEDFDRLLIAALGGGAGASAPRPADTPPPSSAAPRPPDTAPPSSAAPRLPLGALPSLDSAGLWLQPLVPGKATPDDDGFAEETALRDDAARPDDERSLRGPAALGADDDTSLRAQATLRGEPSLSGQATLRGEATANDEFGEETTATGAFDFGPTRVRDGVRVRAGDSISEAICTSPVVVHAIAAAVDGAAAVADEASGDVAAAVAALAARDIARAAADDEATSLPLAIGTSPAILLPAPRASWRRPLVAAGALVAALALVLALRPHRAPPPPPSPSPSPSSAPRVAAVQPRPAAPASPRAAAPRPSHRHHASSRSAR